MVAAFSLVTLLFASVISAKPIVEQNHFVEIPLTRRISPDANYNAVVRDQHRARTLYAEAAAGVDKSLQRRHSVISSPAEFQLNYYSASIGVGDPPTYYNLLIDSGSSNTWVGNNESRPYVKTKTSHQTSNNVSVVYGLGGFNGTEHIDKVTVAPGLVICNQSIGVVFSSNDLDDIDGIIGIGPVDLTSDTLLPAIKSTVPTVTDNLFSANLIPKNQVSVFFAPFTKDKQVNGVVTWGGVNSKNFVGSITYIPITKTFPTNQYWGIDIMSIKYGETALPAKVSSGIVDTGTSLILLPQNVFIEYQKATCATLDSADNTGLLYITPTQYRKDLHTLSFIICDVVFELIPNAQIWPRSLNTAVGGVNSRVYLIVGTSGSESSDSKLKPKFAILGMAFLERYYSVYDTGNRQVGLAKTPFTYADTN